MADRSTRETLMELLRARVSVLVPPEQAGGDVFEPYDVRGFTAGSRAHHAVVTTSHAAVEAVAIELSREVPSAARTFRCLPPIERWLRRQGPRIAVKTELDLLLGAGTELEDRARDALEECDSLKASGGDCATDLGLYISASRRLRRLHAEIAVVKATMGLLRVACDCDPAALSSMVNGIVCGRVQLALARLFEDEGAVELARDFGELAAAMQANDPSTRAAALWSCTCRGVDGVEAAVIGQLAPQMERSAHAFFQWALGGLQRSEAAKRAVST